MNRPRIFTNTCAGVRRKCKRMDAHIREFVAAFVDGNLGVKPTLRCNAKKSD
ncbi:MAG: hypothetical protein Q7T89_07560 [Anaerolineales bacterium]|nr:hypothetical protein [Anaerolineales bacterium]